MEFKNKDQKVKKKKRYRISNQVCKFPQIRSSLKIIENAETDLPNTDSFFKEFLRSPTSTLKPTTPLMLSVNASTTNTWNYCSKYPRLQNFLKGRVITRLPQIKAERI